MVAIAMVYFVTGGFQFTVDPVALFLSGGILVAVWWFFFRKGGSEA